MGPETIIPQSYAAEAPHKYDAWLETFSVVFVEIRNQTGRLEQAWHCNHMQETICNTFVREFKQGEIMHCIFQVFNTYPGFEVIAIILSLLPPAFFAWHFKDEADKGLRAITEQSRAMYVDVMKTIITMSGVVLALMFSSGLQAVKSNNTLWCTTKITTVCWLICICASIVAILALSRGYERALSRHIQALNDSRKSGLEKLDKLNEKADCAEIKPLLEEIKTAFESQKKLSVPRGKLDDSELKHILIPAGFSLSFFLFGFANLILIIMNM
jgi:hypothetical protein